MPSTVNDSILWRYSSINPVWIPNEICGVDYSLMLFGISVLPEYLGADFFKTNNDFFLMTANTNNDINIEKKIGLYPNPFTDNFVLDLNNHYKEIIVEIYNFQGQTEFKKEFKNQSKIDIELDLENGVYYTRITCDGNLFTYKILRK